MKTIWKISGVLGMSLVLAGCSASRLLNGMGLGSSSPAPQAPVVQTGNNLALPPDLQLRPPGTATETYQPNPAPPAPVETASAEEGLYSPVPTTPAPVVKKDIYAEYGISKTKPDGTPKLEGDLKAELKQAMIKRKRETNPGYGTIRNIGNIFSDG